MLQDPIRINRLHAVYTEQVAKVVIVRFKDDGDGGEDQWLDVYCIGGNKYQTELKSKPDPECFVDQDALIEHFSRVVMRAGEISF